MRAGSIFFDILIPNPTTWFYMSLIIAIAIFFQFRKPLSLRNSDLILLYLLAPAMLFLRQLQKDNLSLQQWWTGKTLVYFPGFVPENQFAEWSALAGQISTPMSFSWMTVPGFALGTQFQTIQFNPFQIWLAYLLLLGISALLLTRLILDFLLQKHAETPSNMSNHSLVWLALMMGCILVAKSLLDTEPVPTGYLNNLVLSTLTRSITETAERSNPFWAGNFERILALLCHASVVGLLIGISAWHYRSPRLGICAAVLYLLLPYTALHLTVLLHAVPSVFILVAIFSHRWPVIAGLWLGAATSVSYFPAFLLPLWYFYYRPGHGRLRFLIAFLLVVVMVAGVVLAYLGWDGTVNAIWNRVEWQAWRSVELPQAEGLWNHSFLHQAYRIPIFIGYLCLVSLSAFWPSPKSLDHVINWTAILILGVQFWFADAGGIFILWYLPFVTLILLRGKPAQLEEPRIDYETDWLYRLLYSLFPGWMAKKKRKFNISKVTELHQ